MGYGIWQGLKRANVPSLFLVVLYAISQMSSVFYISAICSAWSSRVAPPLLTCDLGG